MLESFKDFENLDFGFVSDLDIRISSLCVSASHFEKLKRSD